jgi:hypothetical protein
MTVVLKNITAAKKTTTANKLEPGFFAYTRKKRENQTRQMIIEQ